MLYNLTDNVKLIDIKKSIYLGLVMQIETIEAINLKVIPYSESSKIVHVYSKEYGKISLLAKGAKRTKTRFSGRLESFSHNNYTIIKKEGLSLVTEVFTKQSFPNIMKNYEKLQVAYNLIFFVYKIGIEAVNSDKLFQLLLKELVNLDFEDNFDLNEILSNFKLKLLQIEGLLPSELNAYSIDKVVNDYMGV